LPDAGRLGCGNRRQAFVLSLFAWLASFGFVPQPFVMEKNLFSCCPNKFFTAINAFDFAILMLCFGAGQNFVGCFNL
jgi:hypothetical protein